MPEIPLEYRALLFEELSSCATADEKKEQEDRDWDPYEP